MNYTQEFKNLISDPIKTRLLLEGSHFHSQTFDNWVAQRYFITKAIHKSGTILDIGCANGFLLRCLKEWSSYKLEPYGIDSDSSLIKQAKEIFHLQSTNFIVKDISEFKGDGLPTQYDFVYWNVWDDIEFNQKQIKVLNLLFLLVAQEGRLILGFYDIYNKKRRKMKILKQIIFLEDKGFMFSTILENDTPGSEGELIAWIDK